MRQQGDTKRRGMSCKNPLSIERKPGYRERAMQHFSRIPKIMLCVSAIVMLAACGGSSSDSDKSSSTNRSVSGTAAKGIISNAIVTAYALKGFDGTAWEKSQISNTTTDQNGKYSLPIANTTGPVLVVLKANG